MTKTPINSACSTEESSCEDDGTDCRHRYCVTALVRLQSCKSNVSPAFVLLLTIFVIGTSSYMQLIVVAISVMFGVRSRKYALGSPTSLVVLE